MSKIWEKIKELTDRAHRYLFSPYPPDVILRDRVFREYKDVHGGQFVKPKQMENLPKLLGEDVADAVRSYIEYGNEVPLLSLGAVITSINNPITMCVPIKRATGRVIAYVVIHIQNEIPSIYIKYNYTDFESCAAYR